MTWFTDLIRNPFFITSVSSWAIAQVLKEFVGHTMSQVIVGVLIGFANAFVMYRLLY